MSNNVSLTCPSGSNRLVITGNNQQNYLYVTSNRIATPTPASTVNDDSLATTAFVHDLMGFKQCSIVNSADVNTAVGKIYRQGKVVFGRIYQLPKAYTQASSIYSMELTQPT